MPVYRYETQNMAMLADDFSHLLSLIRSCLNMAGVDNAVHLFQDIHTMEGMFHKSPCTITQNFSTLVHADFLPCSQRTVCKARYFLCYFIYTIVQ
jgi:hypothetical protein